MRYLCLIFFSVLVISIGTYSCSSGDKKEEIKNVNLHGVRGEGIAAGKAFFKKYYALEQAFDPALADLYSNDARIENVRTYPNGTKKKMTLPATDYKKLIREVVPLAKSRGDTNKYFNITYTLEGKNVRIKATRHSNLKNYDSPISILITKNKNGIWLIIEELSESRAI
jgi:hypothetical protein